MDYLRQRKKKFMVKRKGFRISQDKNSSVFDFIEKLIEKVIQKLETGDYEVKVVDALRAIQLKEQIKPAGEREKIFWELIEEIRKEELEKLDESSKNKKNVK